VRSRFPAVQPHPHPQRDTRRPHLMREPELAGAARGLSDAAGLVLSLWQLATVIDRQRPPHAKSREVP